MLRPVVSSIYNGDMKYHVTHYKLKTSSIGSQRRHATKRYWIEVHPYRGHRLWYQSFDNKKQEWCKPRKGKFYPFVAISFWRTEITKIYIHKNLHPTYIDEYLRDFDFDESQRKRLEQIKEELEEKWR